MDSLTVSMAAVAALVATAFAFIVADRWHRRRLDHHGAWMVAMGLFATGSFALWWATSAGWSSGVFRVFFTTGAVLNVSWLALGSIALHASRRTVARLRAVLALLSTFALGVMTVAPEKKPFVADDFPQARDHFGALPRTLAAVGSGIPALVIIGLALWSLSRLIRRRAQSDGYGATRLVASNVLVAIATLVLSASGSLAGRLGEEQAFAVTLSVGVVILFVGCMVPSVRSAQRAT
ncbi:MAG: hypothetical protein ACKOAI_06965 [Acidimicrobiia bacterium]